MALHAAALFLIRKRQRELRQAIESSRDDRQYTPHIEEYYIQPLVRELAALDVSKEALEKQAALEELRVVKLPTKAFGLTPLHVGYHLKSENGTSGRILSVNRIETSDNRDNWSISRVEVELEDPEPFSYFTTTTVFVDNVKIELSKND